MAYNILYIFILAKLDNKREGGMKERVEVESRGMEGGGVRYGGMWWGGE